MTRLPRPVPLILAALLLFFAASPARASGVQPGQVTLVSPLDGGYVNTMTPILMWNVPDDPEDMSGDTLHFKTAISLLPAFGTALTADSANGAYTALFAPAPPLTDGVSPTCALTVPGGNPAFSPYFADGAKIYWTVAANDGTSDGPQSAVWSFTIDTSAPAITGATVANDKGAHHVSPDGDGSGDSVTIRYTLSETSAVMIRVYDATNVLRRTLVNNVQQVDGIRQVTWDGTDGAVALPDGVYRIQIDATDGAGNGSGSTNLEVIVDVDDPGVAAGSPAFSANPFSPNADGKKDGTTLTWTLDEASTCSVTVVDAADVVVRTVAPAATFAAGTHASAWDGTDAAAATLADGVYRFVLTCVDPAGNLGQATLSVTLDTTPPDGAPLVDAPDPFSPDLGAAAIGHTLAEQATVEIWIKDVNDVTVRGLLAPVRRNPGTYSDLWNGRNDSGTTLGSGTYTYYLKFIDNAENENTVSGTIRIDTVPPAVAVVGVTPDPFSPNGDGNRDTTKIAYNVTKDATVEVTVWTGTGVLVRTVEVAFRAPSNYEATWDGRDALGAVVADGRYAIRIDANDLAGNAAVQATGEVTVDATAPTLTNLAVAPPVFSPNQSPGSKDTTTLAYDLSETAEVTVEVYTLGNVLVRTLVNKQMQDPGTRSAVWDGKNNAAAFVADAGYILRVTARDAAENAAAPADGNVTVDNAKPALTNLVALPNPFAPNGDGLLETTTVTYTLSDNSALCTVEVLVYLGALKIRDLLAPTPLATGVNQIVWDGKDNAGTFMDDGTYSVRLRAVDEADNDSGFQPVDVRIDKSAPRVQRVRYVDNRNGVITDDTLEVTFTKPVDDSSIVGAAVADRFILGGVGTFGAGASIRTGTSNNDAVIEIRMGGGAIRPVENADTLALKTGGARSLTGVASTDTTPRLVEDGTPPVLAGPAIYVDMGNDGMNAGDTLTLTFDEAVSVVSNSVNGFKLHPAGNFGGGALAQTGPEPTKVVIVLGSSPSVVVRGVYGVDAGATGIEVLAGGNTVTDGAGNYAIPNPAGQPVDVAPSETVGPKVVSAVWSDTATGAVNGGLSAGDEIVVTFDEALVVGGGAISDFKLPVAGDSFGAGATYALKTTKSVAITLGVSPSLNLRGAYGLGLHEVGSPSGIDVNGSALGISDIGGNAATENYPVDIASSDATAPKVLTAKLSGGMGVNLISPTVDLVTIQAIVDDASLKTGDVFADLSGLALAAQVALSRVGNTATFELGTTVVDLTGSRTVRVWAVDYSGNTSEIYSFTAKVVEPAASLVAEVNPSSVPQSAGTRLFRVHAKPAFDSTSRGIDTLRVYVPTNALNAPAGYQYAGSLEVFVGGASLASGAYTASFANSYLAVDFATPVGAGTLNPLIELRFALIVPNATDSPNGKIFTVQARQDDFAATYWQSAVDGDADGIAANNNARKVVVNDLAISSVTTSLDYSGFLWRVNFEVVFNYPLDAATLPAVSFKPGNAATVPGEIAIQNLTYANVTQGDGSVKAVFTGYARIPVDNPDYRNNFTLYARDFRDASGVLIAEVSKADVPMAVGFIITAFTNPMDARDLVVTLRSTAGVVQPFTLQVTQPGDVTEVIAPSKIMTFRQILFQAVHRVDPSYPGQSVIRVVPIDVNAAPPLARMSFAAGRAAADGSVTLRHEETGALFTLPAGAVKAAATALLVPGPAGIALGKESIDRLYDPAEWTPVSPDLEIAGAETFARPGRLDVPVDGIAPARRAALLFARYDAGSLVPVPTSLAGATARGEIAAPGRYGLFLDERAPSLSLVSGGPLVLLAGKDGGSGLGANGVRVEVGGTVYTAEAGEGGLFKLDLSGRVPAGTHDATALAVDRAGNASPAVRFPVRVIAGPSLERVEVFPSPATALVNFRYRLSETMDRVTLTVYDSGNRRVMRRELAGTLASPAPYVETWDLRNRHGRSVANGAYHFEIVGRRGDRSRSARGAFAVLR